MNSSSRSLAFPRLSATAAAVTLGVLASISPATAQQPTKASDALKSAVAASDKALAFKARTTAGQAVDFPASYKGRLVLLDFWATWCGPCVRELPSLTATYKKYHAQGLEVLGISLDQPNAAQKLANFTKQNDMPWPQVYDGMYWQAAVAKLYGIRAIPHAFLVDGDTGAILADGDTLRGANLERTLAQSMAKKKAK